MKMLSLCLFFPYDNIYKTLYFLCIEHCTTEKSKHRLTICCVRLHGALRAVQTNATRCANMLRSFVHRVGLCCMMLTYVAFSLKPVKPFAQHMPTFFLFSGDR